MSIASGRAQARAAEPGAARVVGTPWVGPPLDLMPDSLDSLLSQSSAVLEVMTDGLLVLNHEGAIVFANSAAQTLLGVTFEQMAGRTNLDPMWHCVHEDGTVWPADTHPTVITLRTGLPQRDRVLGVNRLDGEQRWVLVNSVPVCDTEGTLNGVVCTLLDITDRRNADAALEEVRRRLEEAQVLAGLGTWELELASGRLTWSREMFSMFGLDPDVDDVPTPDLYRSLLHPAGYATLEAAGAECLKTCQPTQVTVRAVRADGSIAHLWMQMDVKADASGGVTSIRGTTQDVTQREEAAHALAASEQHFRVAFDNAPIGMSMIGLAPETKGRYLSANAAFCTMLGYSLDELVQLSMADLTHVDDIDDNRRRFEQLASGGATSTAFDKRFRRKDGETVYALLTSSVAQGPTGEALYLITHAVDMTGRRQAQAELERLALSDTLTGLANRTLLTDRVDQALARLRRVDKPCAMLLLDVDRFKLVNDLLGHQVGDALLVEVARRLERVSRADSTVARLGGDEFVVLVEGLDHPDDVHPIAARLLDALRQPYHLTDAGDPIVESVSIGVSIASSPERTHDELYREADLALYRAKDAGRDQYALFDADLRSRVVARMGAEALLRRALAEDLVRPRYQPLINLEDGRIRAVESLARIVDPERGEVLPADFIDVAEETGLIVGLDTRMFELGVQQFASWAARTDVDLRRLATNVSARSLEDPTFVDGMGRVLEQYGIPGSAIQVEVTERTLLASSPVVTESMRRIAEMGMDLGLDDFGTGYSALAYLQRFDLKFLKIDRSFVSRLGQSVRDDAVVAAVIDLAHAHELLVVAEGVETMEQLAALRGMGCDRAQGYLIARPLWADDLVALLQTDPRW